MKGRFQLSKRCLGPSAGVAVRMTTLKAEQISWPDSYNDRVKAVSRGYAAKVVCRNTCSQLAPRALHLASLARACLKRVVAAELVDYLAMLPARFMLLSRLADCINPCILKDFNLSWVCA